MTRFGFLAALIIAMLFIAHPVRADDKVNPAFHAWSNFAVGSSETIEGTIDMGRGPSSSTTTSKLIEKADDHLVVETTQSMVMAGQTHAMPPQQVTIPAAADPSKEMTELGTEDVAVAGKTFSCKIFTPAHPKAGSPLKVKVWACPDVPGGVVKIEIDSTTVKVEQTLKSFEVK
jgi:hypothetical protein